MMTQIHHVVICWQFIEKPHAVIPGEPLHVFRVLWSVPLLLVKLSIWGLMMEMRR